MSLSDEGCIKFKTAWTHAPAFEWSDLAELDHGRDLRSSRIFVMEGHREGVFAFGNKLEEAVEVIMEYYCNASCVVESRGYRVEGLRRLKWRKTTPVNESLSFYPILSTLYPSWSQLELLWLIVNSG